MLIMSFNITHHVPNTLTNAFTNSEPYIAAVRFLRDVQISNEAFDQIAPILQEIEDEITQARSQTTEPVLNITEPVLNINGYNVLVAKDKLSIRIGEHEVEVQPEDLLPAELAARQTTERARTTSIALRVIGMFGVIIGACILIPTTVSFCASVLVGTPIVLATIVGVAIGAGFAVLGYDAWKVGDNVSQVLPNPALSSWEQSQNRLKSSASSELPYYLKDTLFLGHANKAGLLRLDPTSEHEFFYVRTQEKILNVVQEVPAVINRIEQRTEELKKHAVAVAEGAANMAVEYVAPATLLAAHTVNTVSSGAHIVAAGIKSVGAREDWPREVTLLAQAIVVVFDGATALSNTYNSLAEKVSETFPIAGTLLKTAIPQAIANVASPYLFYKVSSYALGCFMGESLEAMAEMGNATTV